MKTALCLAVIHKAADLCNIRCLIADSFHIRDHFSRLRNLAQILCHRLLLQKQPHAEILDIALLLVDLMIDFVDLFQNLPLPSGAGRIEMASSQRAPIRISSTFKSSNCSSNRLRISTKPPRNVIFCLLILRHGEDLLGLTELDHFTQQEEGGLVGDSCCLLHIMGYHDDSIIFF